jgi:Na+/H+ antiporter NhaC
MKPVTDKLKIAREKLAFIIDSTAAPIAGLALISTWVGYELSLIKDSYIVIGQPEINAFGIFVETLPYRFYNILMLAFVFFFAISLREFGPMYKAAVRAHETGQVTNPKSDTNNLMNQENSFMMPKDNITYSIYNAIVSILVLIFVSVIGFYVNGVSGLEGATLEAVNAENGTGLHIYHLWHHFVIICIIFKHSCHMHCLLVLLLFVGIYLLDLVFQ